MHGAGRVNASKWSNTFSKSRGVMQSRIKAKSDLEKDLDLLRVSGKNFNPSSPGPGRRQNFNWNFYFHTSLWCLLRDHKEVWKQTFKLIFILIQFSEMHRAGRVKTKTTQNKKLVKNKKPVPKHS